MPFEVDTISLPLTSKLPPRLGEVSSETFDNPAPAAELTEVNDKLPEPSVIKTWFESPSLTGKVNVTLPARLDEATNDTAWSVPAL